MFVRMADAWEDVTPGGGWPWESLLPGPELGVALAGVEVSALSGSGRVSFLKAWDALSGWAAAGAGEAMLGVADAVAASGTASQAEVEVEARAVRRGFPARELRDAWLVDEVAAALRLAPVTAGRRLDDAAGLLRRWPDLGAAVRAAGITWSQARVIAEEVAVLDGVAGADGRDLSEVAVQRLLPTAGRYAPGRLGARARALVLALAPEAAARRRRAAQRDRSDVGVYGDPDGLATMFARGPAADAVAMRQAVQALAKVLRQACPEPRSQTAGQWRLTALMHALGLAGQPGDTDPIDPGQPWLLDTDPLATPDPLDPHDPAGHDGTRRRGDDGRGPVDPEDLPGTCPDADDPDGEDYDGDEPDGDDHDAGGAADAAGDGAEADAGVGTGTGAGTGPAAGAGAGGQAALPGMPAGAPPEVPAPAPAVPGAPEASRGSTSGAGGERVRHDRPGHPARPGRGPRAPARLRPDRPRPGPRPGPRRRLDPLGHRPRHRAPARRR